MIPTVSWRERYRVRIGFAFAILFLWRAQPRSIVLLFLGLGIALIGVLIRQWAAGCVKKMDELATSGPYALVRHPLYLGSFIAAFGVLLSASSFSFSMTKPYFDRTLFFWAFFWILIDSIYKPKIEQEEKNLEAKFSNQFIEYVQKVPQLFPNRLRFSDLDFSSFRIAVWKKNEEYWSLIGYFILCAILIARYSYRSF